MRTIYRKSFYQWQYIEKFEIDQILECFILELSSEVQVFESFELSTYLQGKFFLNICKKCDGFVPSHDSWYEYSYMSRIEIKPGENISQNLHEFYNSPKGYLLDKHLKKCDCLVPAPEKTWEYSRRNRLRIVYLRNESKERSPVPRTITVAAEKYELSAFMMFSEAGTLASCVKYGQNWFQIESSIISTKLNIEAILEQDFSKNTLEKNPSNKKPRKISQISKRFTENKINPSMSQSFDSLLLDRILCLNPTDDTSYIKLLAKNTVLRIADRLYRLTTNHSLDLKPNKTYDKSIAVLQKMFEEMKVTLKTFYDPLSELTENKSILEFVLDENESKLKDFRNLENKVKNHQEKCLNDEKIIKNGNIEDPVDQNVPEPVPRGPKNCHENDSCPIRVEKTENLMNPTEFVQKTDHLNVKVSNESPNCTESTDEEHPRQELAQNKSPNPCHDFFVTKPIIPTKVFNPKYPVLLLNLPDYLNSPYFNNQNDEEILTDLLKDYKPQTLRRFRYFLFFDEMVRNITRFMGREWALIFIDDKWLLGQCDRSLD